MQTPPTPAGSADFQGHASHGYDPHGQVAQSHVERDDINTGLLSVIFALVAVSFVLVVVLLQAWFYNLTNEIAMSRNPAIDDPQSLLGRALMEQQEKIKDYHWANMESQVRAIPIGRAMDLVVQELGSASSPSAAKGGKENAKP